MEKRRFAKKVHILAGGGERYDIALFNIGALI